MTLTDFEAAVAALLMDPTNVTWDATALDAALRLALADVSRAHPRRLDKAVTLTADGREHDLTAAPFSITGLLWVQEVYWPYHGPDTVPYYSAPFEMRGSLLRILTTSQPQAGDDLRLFYTTSHTIEDLDLATVTTTPDSWSPVIATGAAGYAAVAHSAHLARTFNQPPRAADQMLTFGRALLEDFRSALRAITPETTSAIWAGIPLDSALDPRVL